MTEARLGRQSFIIPKVFEHGVVPISVVERSQHELVLHVANLATPPRRRGSLELDTAGSLLAGVDFVEPAP